MQLGDLVLSMNPETGELAYRPVVRRTVRPRTETTDLVVNGETIGATLAHPVWVIGRGWVQVKDLRAGYTLRGAGSFHPIAGTQEGEADLGYNLEVADFHTFFVGSSKVLVHDSASISDSSLKVPGFASAVGEEPE